MGERQRKKPSRNWWMTKLPESTTTTASTKSGSTQAPRWANATRPAGTAKRCKLARSNGRRGTAECNADDATKELDCFLKCCPVHCVMEKWSEWSDCPPYCGAEVSKRMQIRKRGVETSATCGGDECGPAQEEKECDILQVKNDE